MTSGFLPDVDVGTWMSSFRSLFRPSVVGEEYVMSCVVVIPEVAHRICAPVGSITVLVLVSDFLMVLATAMPPALPDGIAVGAPVGVPAPAAVVPVGQAAVLALGLDEPPAELVPPEEQATRASPAVRVTVMTAPPRRQPVRAFVWGVAFSPCMSMSSSPADAKQQTEIESPFRPATVTSNGEAISV